MPKTPVSASLWHVLSLRQEDTLASQLRDHCNKHPPDPVGTSTSGAPNRRLFLSHALATAGLLTIVPAQALSAIIVPNVTGLYSVQVARIEVPTTTQEVATIVRDWPEKLAVGGGRYSMGGQTAFHGGLHIDMRAMNRLIWLRTDEKVVRVQAGMRWRDLQDTLDPLSLAVKTMQSYSNFTIGGAVSVNAHGRYVGNGPVGNTIRALQIVLANGAVVEANRRQNFDLFRAAIGGYGAVGVITEVELELTDNVRIERLVTKVGLRDYVRYFEENILSKGVSILHNADLLPPLFDEPICTTWRKTSKALTVQTRLVPKGQRYGLEHAAIWAVTELPRGDAIRKSVVQPNLTRSPVVQWLNHEASLDVAELEPHSRHRSTYVLQEYFVPPKNFLPFTLGLSQILQRNKAQALNVSIRHSPADTLSLLPWAKEDVFAFVLYYKQETHTKALDAVGNWTRELINLAIENNGRYYLPYQLHATQVQFSRAYPEASALRELKRLVDPGNKFSNELWAKYL